MPDDARGLPWRVLEILILEAGIDEDVSMRIKAVIDHQPYITEVCFRKRFLSEEVQPFHARISEISQTAMSCKREIGFGLWPEGNLHDAEELFEAEAFIEQDHPGIGSGRSGDLELIEKIFFKVDAHPETYLGERELYGKVEEFGAVLCFEADVPALDHCAIFIVELRVIKVGFPMSCSYSIAQSYEVFLLLARKALEILRAAIQGQE